MHQGVFMKNVCTEYLYYLYLGILPIAKKQANQCSSKLEWVNCDIHAVVKYHTAVKMNELLSYSIIFGNLTKIMLKKEVKHKSTWCMI